MKKMTHTRMRYLITTIDTGIPLLIYCFCQELMVLMETPVLFLWMTGIDALREDCGREELWNNLRY